MNNAENERPSWWAGFRARRREKAQIRRQRANERAESPYRERQRAGHSDNIISDGNGGGI